MGNEISRIEREFILESVSEKGIPVTLSGVRVEATVTVTTIDDDSLEVAGTLDLAPLFAAGSMARAYFSYYGHVMTFSSIVRSAKGPVLTLAFPEHIYKNLERRHARVPAPEGATVSFLLQETKVNLSFPKTEAFNPVEEPVYSEDYDPANIQELIQRFREKISHKVSVDQIKMFRDKGPASFEELLISKTAKILYIPDTAGRFPENDFQMGGRIITRSMMLQPDPKDILADETQDQLPLLLAEKRSQGITAEIYCPILYHQYVVGYIYLGQREGKDGVFDHDLLDYVYQFSQVLAYSLKVSGYFSEQIPDAENHGAEVVDISASGLLFASHSETLSKALMLYADLELTLNVGDRGLRLGARVMRKYEGKSMYYYGMQFMEITPEDFRFLFEYVYGRAVTVNDEELWEGGADPPSLDLG